MNTRPEVCQMCRPISNRCLTCNEGSNIRIDVSSFPPRIPAAWEVWGIRASVLILIAIAIMTGHQ